MNPILLIKMTENDKRVLIALLFIVIIIFVLIGIIGSIMIRTMKWQGKKCDTLVSDVVTNHIVTTPHQLRSYAARKNIRHFIKQAWIGIIILIVGIVILVIRGAVTKDWAYNPFNIDDGFGTLFFVWDFTKIISTPEEGVGVVLSLPALINSPHIAENIGAALPSYFAIPLITVGGAWYFVAAQAYLARTIRAIKLSKKVFEKSLDNFDQNTPPQQVNNPQMPQ